MPYVQSVDFSVKFQWDVGTKVYNDPTTQAELDSLICDTLVSNDTNIPTAAGYTTIGTTNLDTVTGVALSGVLIFSGVSINEVDPLYPAVYGTVTDAASAEEMFDMCLGHP